MRCPNCDQEMIDGSAFCTNCGALMNLDDDKKQNREFPQGNDDVANEPVNLMPVNADGSYTIKDSIPNVEQATNDAAIANETAESGKASDDASYSKIPVVGNKNEKRGFDESMVKSMQTKVHPMRTWSFFWREIVSYLPIINFVVFFIQAFADGVNLNSRSFARAKLIKYLISVVILLALIGVFLLNYNWMIEFIRNSIDYLYNCIH